MFVATGRQTEVIFEVLKAWLKRAPSLKGAALVKLSQLRVQTALWPALLNASGAIEAQLNRLQVSSDNWFDNVLEIYRVRRADAEAVVAETSSSSSRPPQETNNGTAWSYPTIARVFYDSLSHSIRKCARSQIICIVWVMRHVTINFGHSYKLVFKDSVSCVLMCGYYENPYIVLRVGRVCDRYLL